MLDLAQEAFLAYSDETDLELYDSCSDLLQYIAVYRHIETGFVPSCEKRVLGAPTCDWEEERSRALGYLGQYYFFLGQPERVATVWNAAPHRREVDQIIVGMCETIVEKAPWKLNLPLH